MQRPQKMKRGELILSAIALAVIGVLWLWTASAGFDVDPRVFVVPFLGGALYVAGLSAFRRRRLLENLQRMPIRSVPRGLVEIQGTAELFQASAQAPFSGTECLWCSYKLWMFAGKNKQEVVSGEVGGPFYLSDATGSILVNPTGADFASRPVIKDIFPNQMSAEVKRTIGIAETGVLYSYEEQIVHAGDTIYVAGYATDRIEPAQMQGETGVSRTLIQKHPNTEFVITIGIEETALPSRIGMYASLTIGSFLILSSTTILFILPFFRPMAWPILISVFVALVLIAVVVSAIIVYNGLVFLRNGVSKAWGDIDVLLKQRYDEVPNLVETVKGYAAHEKDTMQSVTDARTSYLNAQDIHGKLQAETTLAGGLRHVFAIAEAYPELKANQNFLKLQERLSSIEHEIADRREQYNAVVQQYNTRLEVFPDVLFARPLHFVKAEFFRSNAPIEPVKLMMH